MNQAVRASGGIDQQFGTSREEGGKMSRLSISAIRRWGKRAAVAGVLAITGSCFAVTGASSAVAAASSAAPAQALAQAVGRYWASVTSPIVDIDHRRRDSRHPDSQ